MPLAYSVSGWPKSSRSSACCTRGKFAKWPRPRKIAANVSSSSQSIRARLDRASSANSASNSSAPSGAWPYSISSTMPTRAAIEQAPRRLEATAPSIRAGLNATRSRGSHSSVNAVTSTNITAAAGSIAAAKCRNGSCECCHSSRFCGLPIGLRVEPAFTASASSTTMRSTGRFETAPIARVSGTIRNRLTSLVSTIDSSAVADTSNRPRLRSECARATAATAACCTSPLSRMPWIAISRPIMPARVGNCSQCR